MAHLAAAFVRNMDGLWLPEGESERLVRAGDFDYSRASLALVDEMLGGFHTFDHPLPPDLLLESSAYIFEVARREFGGRYLAGSGDDLYVLVIGEPDFRIRVMVMGKVAGRVANGSEDSIPFFYDDIRPLVDRGAFATLI